MRTLILLVAALIPACTMVSKNLHPELGEYRPAPAVEVIEYDNLLSLNWDCLKQHKIPGFYLGCALVPIDPQKVCIVRVMRGSVAALHHELQHCHGYADTWFPWEAKGEN